MRVWQTTTLVAGVLALGAIAIAAAPQRPASANVLSEHHLEALDGMSPQQQAELLLERAINHYRGATVEIAARAPRWRGKITLDERLNRLFVTAINSDDLAVRIAGIEVDIAARNLITDASTVDCLHNVRYWAVEGLAFLAADAAIEPLLEMFHDDPSPTIRERAACSLAQSGMFSAAQRRKALPRLLDFADDSALDDQTRSWVFQALRDITGESLPRDAHAWRQWYAKRPRIQSKKPDAPATSR